MPAKSDREYRDLYTVEAIEPTEESAESKRVSGQFTTYDSPYMLYSMSDETADYEMWEVVDHRAFDECDLSDVIMQYDHEGRVFARISNGTLELDLEEPRMTAELSGTEIGRQLYEEIRGGYTTKMSFGFKVADSAMNREVIDREGMKPLVKVTRTITKISKLYDVSAVSLPANNQTSISARALGEGVISEAREEFMAARALEIHKAKAIARAKLLSMEE